MWKLSEQIIKFTLRFSL